MQKLGSRWRGAFWVASASLISIAAASPALAQDDAQPPQDTTTATTTTTAQGDQPETEIFVTAQFREQRLQDTPLAITAIPGELLEARSQQTLTDVANQAPNVVLRPQGASFGPSIGASIRGLQQFDFSPALEPTVGIYVDDVYYSSLTGANFDLLDLERIEILRGPQGTTQGRNSIGGAIRLITRRPDGDGGGFVELTYGSRDHVAFRGAANFTIADGLYARIAGVARQQDGFVDRIDYGCANPGEGIPATTGGDCLISRHGGVGYTAVRGSLRYNPGPDVDIYLSADYVRDHRTIAGEILVAAELPNLGNIGLPPGVNYDSRFICGRFCNYGAFAQPAATWVGGLNIPGVVNFNGTPLLATSGSDETTFEGWSVAANVDVSLADWVQLQSITAYREWNNEFDADDDLSPGSLGLGQNALDFWFWSQELRFNFDIGDTIDLTVGGFYSDQRTEYFTYQDIRYIQLAFPLQFTYFPGNDPVNQDTQAVFATAIWNPIEPLTITGGLRYTDEHKDYTYFRRTPAGGDPRTAFIVAPLDGITTPFDGDHLDYRLSADYRFSPELMVYVTTSTGFRGGGVNPRPFNPSQARSFGPDELTNYEIGIKTDLFDRRVRFNVAAFQAYYDGIQLSLLACPQFGGPGPCALPQNAGDARIRGLEFELFARPIDGLQIDASLSWIDWKYTCVFPQVVSAAPVPPDQLTVCSEDPALLTLLGERPPNTPEWRWSAGIQYDIETSVGTFTPRFDVAYNGSTAGGVTSGSGIPLPSFTLGNLRLTWRDADDDWQVALAVTNLFDDYYFLTTFDLRGAGAGFAKAQPGRPREWAITVTRRFR